MSAPSSNNNNNKSQWSAMDLHSASSTARFTQQQQTHSSGYNTRSAAAAANAMRVDDSGLSARNILIRRKLMERKRFDSADHAMKASSNANAAPASDNSAASNAPLYYTSTPSLAATTFSPAHVGASVLYSALGGASGDDDDNVDMDAESDDTPPTASDAAAPMANSSSNYLAQSTAAAARSANRYGNLNGPAGGSASARSILLQKKLREKKHFDSADYQLAQLQPHAAAATTSATSASAPVASATTSEGNSATPMEIDLTPVTATAATAAATINSPSAASLAASRSRMNAQMSPSVRGGKYGSAQSGANVLLMRKLSEKKRFDSADYHMEAAPVAARMSGPQRFFVSSSSSSAAATAAEAAPMSSLPTPPSTGAAVTPAPAPSSTSGASKYGKLSAVNVLIRKKLKERKRFDSADYAMERQGRRQPDATQNSSAQGSATGAFQNGHVVMNRSGPAAADAAAALEDNKSISHQVKHIKLSDGVGGWAAATRVPAGSTDSSASAATGAAASKTNAMSQDSRLVARNLIIQRKLSERKRFDSADYFKEAASRSRR